MTVRLLLVAGLALGAGACDTLRDGSSATASPGVSSSDDYATGAYGSGCTMEDVGTTGLPDFVVCE